MKIGRNIRQKQSKGCVQIEKFKDKNREKINFYAVERFNMVEDMLFSLELLILNPIIRIESLWN